MVHLFNVRGLYAVAYWFNTAQTERATKTKQKNGDEETWE